MENLTYKAGTKYLLYNINWEVKKGEHWLIFGLNGCGKTTLLSILSGYKSPSSGEMEIFGEKYTRNTVFELRKKIGFVSSSFFDKYYKHEPVLQIVLSGLFGTFNIDYDVEAKDVRLAKALLRELRLEDKINAPFHLLSKGERQNVLIARALITRPSVLILDEPGTGLDIYARQHMMNTVETLAVSGQVTVIYVTHYPEEIKPFMNKMMFMKNGKIFKMGNTNEILTSSNISHLLNETVELCEDERHRVNIVVDAETNIYDLCYGGRKNSD